MTDGDALLKDIIDNPDCDTRRLAYADWLEENGAKDRAEYVRMGVRFWAIGTSEETNEERTRMAWRMKQILEKRPLDPGWREVWPGAAFDKRVIGYTTRGLCEFLICPGDEWVRHGDDVLAKNPLRKVVLCSRPELYWGGYNGGVCFVNDPASIYLDAVDVQKAAAEFAGDDVSVGAMYLRWPRKGIVYSMPPLGEESDLLEMPEHLLQNAFDREIRRTIVPPPKPPKPPLGFPTSVHSS